MAARRQFRSNAVDLIETDAIADIKTEIEGITQGAPTVPSKPVSVADFKPKLVEPKFDVEKIVHADVVIMNDGMKKLLDQLPEDCGEMIREYLGSYPEYDLWQVIGGYVMRCREQGTLFSPNILPDWQDQVSPRADRACITCGERMKSKFSQTACCNFCYGDKLGKWGHKDDCLLTKGF